MTCSARSFSLRFSSSASRRSSSSLRPRGRVPAIGMGLDVLPFHAHEHLGRRSDDRELPHPDEIHVRRRVDVAERAIDGQRLGLDLRFEALRQHGLVDVARGDPLLDGAHTRLVLLAGEIRADLRRLAAARRGLREAALELALEKLDLRARELVERGQILVGGHARVGDDQDPVLDVIERQHRVEEHEAGFILRAGFPGFPRSASDLRASGFVQAAFFHDSSSTGSKRIEAS